MEELFDVYNRYGEKTGDVVARGEAHRTGACHRVIHLWIVNEHGQVLIQQRSADKDAGANLWYVSVGGHIAHGEGIEETLIRETREELGLDITGMLKSIEYLYSFKETLIEQDGLFWDEEFFDVFVLRANFAIEALVLQKEEVQAAKYVAYEAFREAILGRDPSFWINEAGFPLLAVALDRYMGRQEA